jgi:hypothetical protein
MHPMGPDSGLPKPNEQQKGTIPKVSEKPPAAAAAGIKTIMPTGKDD